VGKRKKKKTQHGLKIKPNKKITKKKSVENGHLDKAYTSLETPLFCPTILL
jgi:hypothetical protein